MTKSIPQTPTETPSREPAATAGEQTALVAWLKRPEIYPDQSTTVECAETHISWVFLTRTLAYKLKKHVAFDFLDFRSPASRHQACQDEVRLNRRLAADVYLGIDAIVEPRPGEFAFSEVGLAIDWLVRMRRLPSARRLDLLLERGDVGSAELAPLVARLVAFYRGLLGDAASSQVVPQPDGDSADEYLAALERHIRDNEQALLAAAGELPGDPLRRAIAGQRELLKLAPQLLRERVAQGRIVEGHGDLRPEHIYLLDPPAIIDCLEFSAELRRLDVADELAFLAMECDVLGASAVGDAIARQTLDALGDRPAAELFAFYKSYRALVRAKVAALRSRQLAPPQRAESLALAARYVTLADECWQPYRRLRVIVVRGLMGTGKSTLAGALAESLGITLLQTDVVRQELFGSERETADYAAGRYAPERRASVYAALFRRAEQSLAAGASCVLDGTFLTADQRRQAAELAGRCGASFALVDCRCPAEVARERIARRLQQAAAGGNVASEARPELLARQAAEEEPVGAAENSVAIDTTTAVSHQLGVVLRHLAERSPPCLHRR